MLKLIVALQIFAIPQEHVYTGASISGTPDGKRLWAVGDKGTVLESHGR